MTRLFVAIEPSDAARRWLERAAESLGQACAEAGLRARFVRPERFHLTLRFIGKVPEESVTGIATALEGVSSTDRFEIGFSGLGAFPSEKKSRVLWAGLDQGVEGLKSLAEQVDRCLQGVGIAPEERPYRPHLTLARMKKGSENTARMLELVSPREGVSSLVQEVVLFQSDLDDEGPRYTPRARIPLG